MLLHQGSVDIVEQVGPNLADIVDLVETCNGGIAQRVCGGRCGIRIRPNAPWIIDHVGSQGVIGDVSGLLFSPPDGIYSE